MELLRAPEVNGLVQCIQPQGNEACSTLRILRFKIIDPIGIHTNELYDAPTFDSVEKAVGRKSITNKRSKLL